MKKTKKVIASLAIAGMLSMIPFNALAETAVPTRIGGYAAEQTAVQIAEQTGWTGTAILASSASYGMVDALTAGPLASFLKAPILLTEAGNVLNADTKAELTKLKVKTVYVTSGTAVISQAVLDQLTSMDIKVVSLGGVDRFETSVNIAKQMVALGANVSKVAVAYGWLNQDALSIGSIASAQTEPILLTEKDTIPASVKAFLTTNTSVKTTHVIGGPAVVSNNVQAQLPSATRVFGNTAYDTNVAVLKAFDSVLKYDHVFIANGETGIDALAGAPLAAKYNAGIVLTKGVANEGTAYAMSKMTSASIVTALGGIAVVPEVVRAGVVSTAPAVIPGGGGGGGGGGYIPPITAPAEQVISTQAAANAISGPDAAHPFQITSPIKVTVDGITIKNATSTYDITLDPGATGSVTLQNVTANNIIVLSGGQHSINLTNVVAKLLKNQSNSPDVHINLTGGTTITQTESTSIYSAIFEAADGSFGTITITTTSGGVPVIELRGTFTDTIIVGGGISLIAAPGANIANLQINAAVGPSNQVTLTGDFNTVTVNSQADITVGANSSIANVVAHSATNIVVPAGSTITMDPISAAKITTTGSGTVQTADMTTLTAAISRASTLLSQTNVGVKAGEVPLSAKTTFQAAIDAAIAIGQTPTQAQISGQLVALSAATINFNNAVITNPKITDCSSIANAVLDENAKTLSFTLTDLQATSGIKVSKDSKLSLSIGNSGPIGDFNLVAGQINTLLNSPLPASLNLSQTNMTAIFDAIMKLDAPSKQALLNTADFAKLLDLVKQTDVTTQNAVYQSIGFSDLYKAISSADSATKLRILDNMTAVLDVALKDPNSSTFKTHVKAVMTAALLKSNLTFNSAQLQALLDYPGTNTSLKDLLTNLNLTAPEKEAILDSIDFTALFNAVELDLSATTRASMFKTINFTDLFNAVKSASPTTKATIYANMLNVVDTIKKSSIPQVDILNALVFGVNNKDALFQILKNLDGTTNAYVTVTATLTDAASNASTYTFKISR